MKIIKNTITALSLMALSSAHAATFVTGGNIEDGAGNIVGSWAYDTVGTVSLQNVTEGLGANGIDLYYAAQGNATTADTLATNITITAASGYQLDSIIISQNNYGTAGNAITSPGNGSTSTTDLVLDTVAGYTGAFTFDNGSPTAIFDPAVVGGDLTWNLTSGQNSATNSWFVSLDDVTSGATYAYTHEHTGSLFNESVNFDAVITEIVPEPSSVALLGLGGIALLTRRSRK